MECVQEDWVSITGVAVNPTQSTTSQKMYTSHVHHSDIRARPVSPTELVRTSV